MAGNRTKGEATKRLTSMGLAPGYVQEEEAAAFFSMSVGAYRRWQEREPRAPKPHWLGENCKRYRMADLANAGGPSVSSPSAADPIMEAINAIDFTPLR